MSYKKGRIFEKESRRVFYGRMPFLSPTYSQLKELSISVRKPKEIKEDS